MSYLFVLKLYPPLFIINDTNQKIVYILFIIPFLPWLTTCQMSEKTKSENEPMHLLAFHDAMQHMIRY